MTDNKGDYYYYMDGEFFDRMSNDPEYISKAYKAKVIKIEGDRVYLRSSKETKLHPDFTK